MFYCEPCRVKNDWPKDTRGHPSSRVTCEMCDEVAACYDLPSSTLPRRKVPPPPAPIKNLRVALVYDSSDEAWDVYQPLRRPGWSVELEDNLLIITAPAQEVFDWVDKHTPFDAGAVPELKAWLAERHG